MGPPGPVALPSPKTVLGSQPWNSVSDNTWRAVPAMNLTFNLANASPTTIAWALAVPMNGHIVTRLNVDGVVLPGSQMVNGNTTFVAVSGTIFTTLAAGSHTVVLEYRAPQPFSFDPTTDWQTSRLQVVTFDQ
jgi:hypothetical protein